MSIATPPISPTIEQEGDQRVVLRGVDWDGYAMLLRLKGDRRDPKMIYLDGSVILVSPSDVHHQLAEILGLFVFVLAEELDIPCKAAGSATFRRQSEEGGVEGDKTFYFTNLDRIRGKKELKLPADPPPDLAIEVVVSHDADDAIEVWRRFGVPEVWVCTQQQLTILRLGANDQYAESGRSLAFPVLEPGEIHAWASRDQDENDLAWAKELRRWVKQVRVPRRGGEPS